MILVLSPILATTCIGDVMTAALLAELTHNYAELNGCLALVAQGRARIEDAQRLSDALGATVARIIGEDTKNDVAGELF